MIGADTLEITPEILSLIAELEEFKGAWYALAPWLRASLSITPRRYHRKHRLIDSDPKEQTLRPRSGATALKSGRSNLSQCETSRKPYNSLGSVIEQSKESYYLSTARPRRRSEPRPQTGSRGFSFSFGIAAENETPG